MTQIILKKTENQADWENYCMGIKRGVFLSAAWPGIAARSAATAKTKIKDFVIFMISSANKILDCCVKQNVNPGTA